MSVVAVTNFPVLFVPLVSVNVYDELTVQCLYVKFCQVAVLPSVLNPLVAVTRPELLTELPEIAPPDIAPELLKEEQDVLPSVEFP